jgi:hypothetical protein
MEQIKHDDFADNETNIAVLFSKVEEIISHINKKDEEAKRTEGRN